MVRSLVQNIDAVVLAGGDSSRLLKRIQLSGKLEKLNKATLPWGDDSLLDHVTEVCKSVFERVIVLSNEPVILKDSSVPVFCDQYAFSERSSKVGILNALALSNTDRVCITACDMPLVSAELLYLLSTVLPDRDLVMPLLDRFFQPMPAIYHKSCIPVLIHQLTANNHRLLDFFGCVRLGVVDDRMLSDIAVGPETFLNVNTWTDYQEALEAAGLSKIEEN